MSISIFRQLRFLINEIYSVENDSFRVEPLGRYELLQKDSKRMDLAKNFVSLVIDTRYFTDTTKVFLTNPLATADDIVDIMHRVYNIDIKKNTVYTQLNRDKEKFIKDVGSRFFMDITTYEDSDISEYEVKLDKLLNPDINDLMQNSLLDISSEEFVYEVDDSDFEVFIARLRPYTKRAMKRAQSALNKDMLAYVHYITTHEAISEMDKVRLKRLKKLLM